ncbi:MAG: AAA family ATPase [Conexivisphaera sp.]
MLFDLMPKRRREDLYDFEEEMRALMDACAGGRLVVITALRRMGKTSLLLTSLNEGKLPYVFLDARRVVGVPGARGLAEELERGVNEFVAGRSSVSARFLELLRGVRGVDVDLVRPSVRVHWGRRDRLDVAAALERLDDAARGAGTRIVVALDEAQEFRTAAPWLPRLLAYAYDHLEGIVLVVSGSQVGVLRDFLGVDDPHGALYGRFLHEVRLRRLSREEAVDYLRRGFSEVGVAPPEDVLQEAVERFDGIIGWLTYFGWSYSKGMGDVESILDMAARQEAEELRRFLSGSVAARRYRAILKAAARGPASWSSLKGAVEVEDGVEVDPHNFNDLLQRLVKMGFLEREGNGRYVFADRVLATAAAKYV